MENSASTSASSRRRKRKTKTAIIIEEISKKWNDKFQEKVSDFPNKWSLQFAFQKPAKAERKWEEPLKEKLKLFFKCKLCNSDVGDSHQGKAIFYFHLDSSNAKNEIKGEVLFLLRSETCPGGRRCMDSQVDAYDYEMEAVLSYLQMELGFHYYGRAYTEEDEFVIETRRSKRQAKPVGVNCSCKNNGKRKVSKHAERWKKQFDKSEEEIRAGFELFFRSYFDKFTEKKPSDRWLMTIAKGNKNHPLIREEEWTRFLGEQTTALFQCKCCGNVWESFKGWVAFWIWQADKLDSNGIRQGKVVAHVFGQKCSSCRCPAKKFEIGDICNGANLDAVMAYLYLEIDYYFYDNQSYTDQDEKRIAEKLKNNTSGELHYKRRITKRPTHLRMYCQACKKKTCGKRITAVYPNLPEP